MKILPKYIFFLGVGGIGMSALARYFKTKNHIVYGYDKTETHLTKQLSDEGIKIYYEDKISLIPEEIINGKNNVLVVYTPAIPVDNLQFQFFQSNSFQLVKRAEVLGIISANYKTIAVAGTHGKTTTSAIAAHIFYSSEQKCNAFLGGLASNYNSNFLTSNSLILVAEADEYDRSFLTLKPDTAIITSVDPDHLDIYNNASTFKNGFEDFTACIENEGKLILKKGLELNPKTKITVKKYTYHLYDTKADFFASNIVSKNGKSSFTLNILGREYNDFIFGMPGLHNLENAIAASAAAFINGVQIELIASALHSFKGIKRRFEIIFSVEKLIYIDDYAHHPQEIKRCIESVKSIFPNKKITGIFQPHLFSRTKDFAEEFANELSKLDDCILLEIYPAREEAIEGINAEFLLKKIQSKKKSISDFNHLLQDIDWESTEILITMGAGNIDLLVSPIKNFLEKKFK